MNTVKGEPRYNSAIQDLFRGQLQSTVQCPHCRACSRKLDDFMDISLPLPGQASLSMRSRTCSLQVTFLCSDASLDHNDMPLQPFARLNSTKLLQQYLCAHSLCTTSLASVSGLVCSSTAFLATSAGPNPAGICMTWLAVNVYHQYT